MSMRGCGKCFKHLKYLRELYHSNQKVPFATGNRDFRKVYNRIGHFT
jgi:hypothetical protein